ncbi:disulfide bond formation protein B [Aquirhabdus parva]|uniref:Disulfide bond formation protein B n=1 Tax=Aquirhabdus parva TaxID=2283318 RepID=A0A345PA84_9GAMM|nr:disulfide bond formation protein B [Aquirhabdus parva]AXI04193.1 disulfide bond formation protein B [Aquirhabdus parva]
MARRSTQGLSYRRVSFGLFLASVAGMGFALYLQHFQHLDPCPLCIFQRIGLMIMGFVALIAALHNPKSLFGRRFYSLLATLGILWSVGVAGRHVWLQHLPPEDVPACGPGLDYWLQVFPLQSVVQKVLHGSGECAKVDWTLLGWSLPHWGLLFFTGLLLINLWQLTRRSR